MDQFWRLVRQFNRKDFVNCYKVVLKNTTDRYRTKAAENDATDAGCYVYNRSRMFGVDTREQANSLATLAVDGRYCQEVWVYEGDSVRMLKRNATLKTK